MREIIWAKHGENAFNEILDYITKNSGPLNSNKVYEKVISEIELLKLERIITRKSQELVNIGINDIYEINVNPWKVYLQWGLIPRPSGRLNICNTYKKW
jgi:hypothetical protein